MWSWDCPFLPRNYLLYSLMVSEVQGMGAPVVRFPFAFGNGSSLCRHVPHAAEGAPWDCLLCNQLLKSSLKRPKESSLCLLRLLCTPVSSFSAFSVLTKSFTKPLKLVLCLYFNYTEDCFCWFWVSYLTYLHFILTYSVFSITVKWHHHSHNWSDQKFRSQTSFLSFFYFLNSNQNQFL